MKKKRVLYFAYGQMMNPDCMKKVCSRARAVCTATLKNYRLAERRYADIDPDPASEVYGILYAVTPGDRKKLDRHAASMGFAEMEVEVVFGEEKYKALTSMMTPEGKKKNDGNPYGEDYIRQCRNGALCYLAPDSFRFVNVIVFGPSMTGEPDDTFEKHAVAARPCTLTGTLYATDYGYPVFSQEGNTVVEAEYIRIPRDILEDSIDRLIESPFTINFLVAKAPDGSTFGGWAVCMEEKLPHVRGIESGCWRARRRLRYDALDFVLTGIECSAELKIDFSQCTISAELHHTPPDGETYLRKGTCRFGKYWRRELLAALRECRFERWQTRYSSNGDKDPLWYVDLKKGEDSVKFIRGSGVIPLNWDMFKNVFALSLRLACGKEYCSAESEWRTPKEDTSADRQEENRTGNLPGQNAAQVTPPPGGPAEPAKKEPETETKSALEAGISPRKPESAPVKSRKAKEPAPELEPELPLFDGDVPYSASGLLKGETRNDAAPAGSEPVTPAEQNPGAGQNGRNDPCPNPEPPPPDSTDRK